MKRIFVLMLAVLSLLMLNACHPTAGSLAHGFTLSGPSMSSTMTCASAQMLLPFAAQGCAKLAPVIINKCETLTPKQTKDFKDELAKTKDLDRAIIIYKTVPCGNPLEKTAKIKIILILRDYELPKARTAKDFLNLCNRMPWTLCDVKKGILKTAVNNLENKHEIQKIIDVIYPKSDEVAVAGKKKIKEIEKRMKENKR